MISQIIIGLTTEGSTDIRFLENIVQRTFEHVALECKGPIEILPLKYIHRKSGDFSNSIVECSRIAHDSGVMVLCVHIDADSRDDNNAFNYKIKPAFQAVVNETKHGYCKNLVSIIPIQMTESWMLSDKDLLKSEIGTTKNDKELLINKHPESFDDPKAVIQEAIRISRSNLTRRRRYKLDIRDLYGPLGQKIGLTKLENLTSYKKFQENVKNSLISLSYLAP